MIRTDQDGSISAAASGIDPAAGMLFTWIA
jgi:hypothetical protein